MSVKAYNTCETCPSCNSHQSVVYVEMRKIGEHIDYSNMENSTVTYKRIENFRCKICKHEWRKGK